MTSDRSTTISPNTCLSRHCSHSQAGNGRVGFSGDGGPAVNSALRGPSGLIVDTNGNVFFADSLSHRIRMLIFHFSGYQLSASSLSFTGSSGGAAPVKRRASTLCYSMTCGGPVPGTAGTRASRKA